MKQNNRPMQYRSVQCSYAIMHKVMLNATSRPGCTATIMCAIHCPEHATHNIYMNVVFSFFRQQYNSADFMHMRSRNACTLHPMAVSYINTDIRCIRRTCRQGKHSVSLRANRIAVYAAAFSRHPQNLYERRTTIAVHIARTAIWQPAQCTTHKANEL